MKASALIPAAGRGERLGRGSNKAFVEVAGRPLLAHTLSIFQACEPIDEIVIVTGRDEIEPARRLAGRFGISKVSAVVVGGEHRQESVKAGLKRVTCEIVAIHDAARPMITVEIIERSIEAAARVGACIVAVPVIDTIKSCEDGFVERTIDRARLYSVQTPQTFRTEMIKTAYERAFADGHYATDDSALIERLGGTVEIVEGSYDNIKITTPFDLDLAEARLGGRQMRTGIGIDVHAFAEGRKLVLGGVEIEHEKGLAGHSDADVLLHAVADACLGAACLGDIGRHFPDTDPQYKGISSLRLLSKVAELLAHAGWSVGNVDSVIICERPKVAAHAAEMAANIAGCLGIDPSCVSVKGTTTERLGFTGRGEGIACEAVVTVTRTHSRMPDYVGLLSGTCRGEPSMAEEPARERCREARGEL